MADQVGSAAVAIFPVFKGFRSKVSAEVNGATKAAGQSAGKGFSAAFDSGSGKVGDAAAKNLQRNVASASQTLSKARLAEQDAAGKVRVAEAQLADARSKGAEGSARVVAAEERLESANRKLASAQERTKASSDSLKSAQSSLQTAMETSSTKAQSASSRIREALSGAASKASEVAGRISSAIGTAFSTAGKIAGTFAGIVGGILGGIAIKGGISRVLDLEDARASLSGLGHSVQAVDAIMTNALDAVKGTAFTMGEAGGVAASAVAAGIKPGEDLRRVLGLVADSASIAKTDMGDMGAIFNKVAAKGKLDGDILNQLMERQIGILPALAEQFGVTNEEATKLVSDGKVSFQDFADVMETTLGGAALKSGETFRGALKNTKSALSRIGETIVTPFLGMINAGFNALIPVFDAINAALEPVMAAFADSFGPKVQGWMSALTDAGAALPAFFGRIGEAVGKVREFIAPVSEGFNILATAAGGLLAGSLGPLLTKLPLVGGLFTGITGPIGLVIGAIVGLITQSAPLRDALGSGLQTIFQALTDTMTQIGPVLAEAGTALLETIGSLGDILAPVITTVVDALAQIIPVVGEIVAAVLPSLMSIIQAVVPVIGQLVSAILPVVTTIIGILVPVIQALLPVITTVFGVIASVVTAAMQIVQGIIQVVTGIISGNWSQVWDGIKNILAGVWNTIKALITGALVVVKSVILGALNVISSLWNSVWSGVSGFLSSIWDSMTRAVANGINNVVNFVSGIKDKVLGAVSGAGQWLWSAGQNVVQGLLDGIRSLAGSIGNFFLDLLPGWIVGPFKAALGIHSPSRVFAGFGENIGEGVMLGVGRTEKRIDQQMRSLVTVPPAPQLTTAGTGRAAATSNPASSPSAGVQVTIQGNVGWSATELADQLDTRIRRGVNLNNLRRGAFV